MHLRIWNDFCDREKVVAQAVPLFKTDSGGHVETRTIGRRNKREILARSEPMEQLVIDQVNLLIADVDNGQATYDGLIYMMLYIESGSVKPLYIGKTELRGRKNDLSVNITKLQTDKSKFARWGDNYQYHIGDLSAVVLNGHHPKQQTFKYTDWAKAMFTDFPTDSPELQRPVFFWCKAWRSDEVGIWEEFGATRLTFLEYLLIGVASASFPELLLNREGQNR
ncbi:hypothetical protein L4C42_16240 [Vibrio wakamikoensis]|uniref:hypothetical protein n=1 Tax=Vibrio wakamikoensis TaxID=2910251 RepID=UPI003D24FEA9